MMFISIADVDSRFFDMLPDRWQCCIKTVAPTKRGDPDQASCEVNYDPDDTLHEINDPGETVFIVNDPDDTLLAVNDADRMAHDVKDPDQMAYELNDPDQMTCELNDPDQMSREVNDPDHTLHEVKNADTTLHEVNDPDHSLHEVNDPDEMTSEVNDPDETLHEANDADSEVNDPDHMLHEVNDPDEALQEIKQPNDRFHDVKPDINDMEIKCTVKTSYVEENKTKLGRGCRRKRSTFHEMSCDYVMPSKGRSTGSDQRVDPGGPVDEETDPRHSMTPPDSPIPRRGRKRKRVTDAAVISTESNDDRQSIDSVVAQVKTEVEEDGSCNGGEFDAEPCTNSTERVRRVKNKKPYTAYERVIRDKRTAMAALSKHEYHCALCPSYVCYSGKTLHNHIVFKHKMSSSAYQEFVAAHPMDSNGRYGAAAWTENDPGCDDNDTNTSEEVVKLEGGAKKKQCRRTLDSVEKTFGCLVCSQRFVQRTSMIKHVKQMHMTLDNTEEMLRLLEQDKVAHAKQLSPIAVECPVCSAELRGKRIISHMKKVPTFF